VGGRKPGGGGDRVRCVLEQRRLECGLNGKEFETRARGGDGKGFHFGFVMRGKLLSLARGPSPRCGPAISDPWDHLWRSSGGPRETSWACSSSAVATA
jgi:hypothetical protein